MVFIKTSKIWATILQERFKIQKDQCWICYCNIIRILKYQKWRCLKSKLKMPSPSVRSARTQIAWIVAQKLKWEQPRSLQKLQIAHIKIKLTMRRVCVAFVTERSTLENYHLNASIRTKLTIVKANARSAICRIISNFRPRTREKLNKVWKTRKAHETIYIKFPVFPNDLII